MQVVIVILVLLGLNLLWLSIYCRVEAKVDVIKKKKPKDNNVSTSTSDNKSGVVNKKNIFKEIYKEIDHYFYGWMRYCIILVGYFPSNRIRKILYKYIFCMKVSKKTVISMGCEFRSPWNIKLGRCIIASGCLLDGRSGIEICDDVVLGANIHIWTQEHDINSPSFAVTEEHMAPVVLNRHVWICSDSTILPGVVVGEGAVVASRACVTKNCEAFAVYGGVPAKKIGARTTNLTYELSGKPHWHFT